MDKNRFWHDASKCGAVIGALLCISSFIEYNIIISGKIGLYSLFAIEWLGAVVLHYYLLHRYTRERSRLYSRDDGFTFGQGYSFILATSLFAGFIFGAFNYLYQFIIIGYSQVIDQQIAAITQILSISGSVDTTIEAMLRENIKVIKAAPEPNILQIIWGGITASFVFGGFFGAIIAGTSARQPQPFDNNDFNTNVNE